MATNTNIEWTDTTWNPIRGCSVVSPGCKNCYAMKQAHRFSGPGGPYEGLTQLTSNGPVWTGKVSFHEDVLEEPYKWRVPRRVFVNSMSDLFHDGLKDREIMRIFSVMASTRRHTYQVLTKRPERMRRLLSNCGAWEGFVTHNGYPPSSYGGDGIIVGSTDNWPLQNVWLGVSCENQKTADERVPILLQTPAAVRWMSAEPLLGPINLNIYAACHTPGPQVTGVLPALDWVVAGGESGPGARSMEIQWARSLMQQCKATEVPFFMKQLGRWPISKQKEELPWAPLFHDQFGQKPTGEYGPNLSDSKGGVLEDFPKDLQVREYPETIHAS